MAGIVLLTIYTIVTTVLQVLLKMASHASEGLYFALCATSAALRIVLGGPAFIGSAAGLPVVVRRGGRCDDSACAPSRNRSAARREGLVPRLGTAGLASFPEPANSLPDLTFSPAKALCVGLGTSYLHPLRRQSAGDGGFLTVPKMALLRTAVLLRLAANSNGMKWIDITVFRYNGSRTISSQAIDFKQS